MTRTCINCVYVLEWLVCLGNSPSLFSRPRAVSSDHRGNMNMYTALRWSHHNITWIFIYLHADWCSVKICVSEGCWMKIYASFVSKMVLILAFMVPSLRAPSTPPSPTQIVEMGTQNVRWVANAAKYTSTKSNYREDIENNPNPPQYCCKLIFYRTPAPP